MREDRGDKFNKLTFMHAKAKNKIKHGNKTSVSWTFIYVQFVFFASS